MSRPKFSAVQDFDIDDVDDLLEGKRPVAEKVNSNKSISDNRNDRSSNFSADDTNDNADRFQWDPKTGSLVAVDRIWVTLSLLNY